MRFAAAQHTKVASQFSVLLMAVSLAAQSIIDHLHVDVPTTGVVGEIVARFQVYADQFSRLEAVGLGVCNLVLGPVGDETNVDARLEEVIGRLRMAQGGQGGLGI
jgi:hypothetical protein